VSGPILSCPPRRRPAVLDGPASYLLTSMTELQGAQVRLRPAATTDIAELARIRATPEVRRRWRGGEDMTVAVADDLAQADVETFVIELDGRVVGATQWHAETEPDYRHASIDIYLDPVMHGRGLGTDAVRTLARHLIVDQGHHRLVIDPAADNAAAIRTYSKVGFRPVGLMRRYERDMDGTWRDGLLMDLLADELIS
jgi:aminoglycoside 6'-N-acetyltransferase